MINNVVLVGRLTRDVELRYTPSNQAVATFTLAVNRNFKNQDGEREADFINCVMWRQQAENLANWTKKGALIGVTGRIQTRNYENQLDGEYCDQSCGYSGDDFHGVYYYPISENLYFAYNYEC